MSEYLRFNKMITPMIIQVLFWVFAAVVVLAGLFQLTQNFLTGLVLIILGPIGVRIYAELLIVLFQINAALQDIRGTSRRGGTAVMSPAASPATGMPGV